MKALFLIAALAIAAPAAADVTLFGSAGAESQHAPANAASPLNPANFLSLRNRSTSADFAVFVTAAQERWKIKTKIRGDAEDGGEQRVEVAEASLQWQISDAIDVTAGRVIEKWGAGYGWTPTSFIGPARNPADPGDRRSLSRGREMIRLSALAGETQLSLYLLEAGAAAVRVQRLIAGTDVALMAYRDGDTHREGISLSRVFGDALELHADAALSQSGYGRASHAVVGGQYTWKRANFVVELHHRSDGLSPSQWSAFRAGVDDALRTNDFSSLVASNRSFTPLQMGRRYTFVRAARALLPIVSDAELIVITNLHDGSSVVRAALTRKLQGNLDVFIMNTEFVGAEGSELSYIQVGRITTAGLRLHF
ncbi:MAG TPA: hypothetical protein VFT12_07850 [Thermoanaerobaculia bacterium]|nr:hypothetical protein [Thermoanaerobaculia bacterium]